MSLDNKTRLNSAIRQHIVNKALETSGVDAEDIKLIDDRAAFAEKVRAYCVKKAGFTDADLRAEYDRAVKAYENDKLRDFIYLSVSVNSGSFRVNINGQTRDLRLDGASGRYYHEKTHIEIKSVGDGGPIMPRDRINIASNDFMDEISALDERQKQNNARREEIQKTVEAAVKRVGTVGKLLEQWPAAEELLPKEYKENKATALALNAETLNALCGIPSDK